ncbi:RES family NAD+ phosphorylase [Reinekea sp. G2M2-21]|uniref:RES family NAD+ phosphorylase n=1 Tax=Reinekea sp. G2M2-21 TaxID=2788942 RepID=UPI001E2F6F61|nr:RES domain-containing protein [Reinekea sp. G2M2-21]
MIGYQGICYRAHDPRWVFEPISGEGAKINGGRFNRIGVGALYLGMSLESAICEASQGMGHKIQPLTICCYEVNLTNIVDLTDSRALSDFNIDPADLGKPWAYALAEYQRSKASEPIFKKGRISKKGIGPPILVLGDTSAPPNKAEESFIIRPPSPVLHHKTRPGKKTVALPNVPPTWAIADKLINSGAHGIIVPSFASGATDDHKNLVLWVWGGDTVRVEDTHGRLPKDQSSFQL